MSTAADVDLLMRLMPPPADGGRTVDWDEMARSWGRPFPPDYMRFMEVYGAGVVQDFLVVVAPQPNGPLAEVGWDGMVEETGNAEDTWADAYKAPGLEGTSPRLIAWGAASSADLMCWDASGEDPAAWPVLVFNRGKIEFSRYDCGMAEFLTRLLRGEFPECPLGDVTLWERGEAAFKKLG
ncbi:SMI1/KNR4 family protein [Streptomyces sp. Ru71]|uniref:SMI1/KNR4 family protein n=1 Tax=Streptomyces sp. Ru71 TaxID=2080746 RepID=UPI000CDD495E|nr:SMI1/KNR4 family protein [Streptomyces sp. Ru71]POX52531.1 SMI1/KNR4 family protein [Streptomyces sp. Ru71]